MRLTAWSSADILRAALTINDALTDHDAAAEALAEEIHAAINAARGMASAQGYRNLLGRSVSMTHMHVLATLRGGGPLRMSELARRLDISLANATGIVTRMEERGLVARARDEKDRRVVTVALAEGGLRAFGEMDARSREFFATILRQLTPDELAQLRNGMQAMFRAAKTVVDQRTTEGMDR